MPFHKPTLAASAIASFLLFSYLPAQIPDSITFTPMFGTNGNNQFTRPAMLLEIPGKPGHFVVPEIKSGKIFVLSPNGSAYSKTLFGTIPVFAANEDMGLIGFVFHPDFVTNRKYYVKYGNPARPPRQICYDERLAATDYLHDSGQPGRRLLTLTPPEAFSDHNGGSPVFGPDGYLYLAEGDGGWDIVVPDPYKNGQNREVLNGKILRIDVDKKDPGLEYAIPADNPFVNDTNPKVRKEIWAYGIRNPFRMAFDKATQELYVGDVGWVKFDEVNVIKKGANYGWSIREGAFCPVDSALSANDPSCNTAIEAPVATMANGTGTGMGKCVIGGQVYRGDANSRFYGVYIYGDYLTKKLFALKKPASGPAVVKEYPIFTPQEPLAFNLDAMNNIYMTCYAGTIYKLVHPELKAVATTSILAGSTPTASRGRIPMALVLSGMGHVLPAGLIGRYEAIGADGTRLGILSLEGGHSAIRPSAFAAGSASRVVFLRPVANP